MRICVHNKYMQLYRLLLRRHLLDVARRARRHDHEILRGCPLHPLPRSFKNTIIHTFSQHLPLIYDRRIAPTQVFQVPLRPLSTEAGVNILHDLGLLVVGDFAQSVQNGATRGREAMRGDGLQHGGGVHVEARSPELRRQTTYDRLVHLVLDAAKAGLLFWCGETQFSCEDRLDRLLRDVADGGFRWLQR